VNQVNASSRSATFTMSERLTLEASLGAGVGFAQNALADRRLWDERAHGLLELHVLAK
jgi:hypothetical protein